MLKQSLLAPSLRGEAMRLHRHRVDLPNTASLGEILVTLWGIILYAAKMIGILVDQSFEFSCAVALSICSSVRSDLTPAPLIAAHLSAAKAFITLHRRHFYAKNWRILTHLLIHWPNYLCKK